MGLLNGKILSPKESFLSDLKTLIKDFQSQSNDILICDDFNKPLDCTSNSFELARSLGLVDILDSLLGTTTFNTHQHNQSDVRIDCDLVSPDLLHSIQHAGYFPFGL